MVENNQSIAERSSGTDNPAINRRIGPRATIGVRFITFVVLIAILAGGIVGFVAINTSSDALRQEVLQNNLVQAQLAADFASTYINIIQGHLKVFASRPDVRQAVLNNAPEQLQPELAQFVQVQTVLESASVLDSKGVQIASRLAGSTSIGQSFADRDYFQQVVATGQPSVGTAVKSRVTGQAITTYAVPITDSQSKLRGVLLGAISLAKLSDAIVKGPYSLDTRAVILDFRNEGVILAHEDPKLLLTPLPTKHEVINRLLLSESGAIETAGSSGAMDLIGFAPVPDLPWGIMVITPSEKALTIVPNLTQQILIDTGLIILFAAIFGIVLVLGVTRPLARLAEGTTEIGRGNLDYKVATSQRDEIGDLSRAVGHMAQELKQTLVSRDELAREIVEHKKTENSLIQRTEELQRSNAELERFAYVASHDLQEPLRMVSSYTQLLERRYKDKLDADANDFINYAVDGAKRMQQLINDLLAYSRVGTRGRLFERVDCQSAVNAAIANLDAAIRERNARITRDPLPVVRADEGQMVQLFQNLIGNAIKFNDKPVPEVHVSAKLENDKWIFSVRDNGIGIDPEYFNRIFIIFQRLHSGEYPGTGIGLAISKKIVERHGGQIWIESRSGSGSTFYFTLPEIKGQEDNG